MSSKIQRDRSGGKLFYRTNRCTLVKASLFSFSSFPVVAFSLFFLFPSARWIRVGKFFLPRFLRSCDEGKSAREKVGVIRNRGNTESTSSSLSPL